MYDAPAHIMTFLIDNESLSMTQIKVLIDTNLAVCFANVFQSNSDMRANIIEGAILAPPLPSMWLVLLPSILITPLPFMLTKWPL